MSRQKERKPKKIKHDLFERCAELEPNPYWKSIFINCAYGHFPQDMTFKDNILRYRKAKRKQAITYAISQDPETAILNMKEILRKEKHFVSVDELTRRKIQAREKLAAITLPEDSTWSMISKSTLVKNLAIATYVREMQFKLHLSDFEAEQLKKCICIGLTTKVITGDDISMIRGEITEIGKISRDSTGFHLTRKPVISSLPRTSTVENIEQISCVEGWDKYNQSYKKLLKGPF